MESGSLAKQQKVIDLNRLNINDLPEIILSHILSFLPTKYAVQTSVLSTRWRYLWTLMPILDFDDSDFHVLKSKKGTLIETMRFVNFVNEILLLHDMPYIQRFSVASFYFDISHFNTWINVAARKNVEELYIDIKDKKLDSVKLPNCLFTCTSLVSLKLKFVAILRLPTSICLTRLKILHLDGVIFKKPGSFQELLSSCPILENLDLVGCWWWDSKVDISPISLRNLCICDCVAREFKLKISVPELISFKFIDFSAENYFQENLSSLDDVFIHIKIRGECGSKRFIQSVHRVCKLLKGVSKAKSLTLSDTTLERLTNASNLLKLLPTFHNLNKLMVTSGRIKRHFLVIALLLKSSPILESLVINIEPSRNYESDLYKLKELEELKGSCLRCLLHDRLKVVKIRCFGGTQNELEFVKLLLRSACNLERLIFVKGVDLDKIPKIRKKLQLFQKASSRCIISVL